MKKLPAPQYTVNFVKVLAPWVYIYVAKRARVQHRIQPWTHTSASRNLLIISKRDTENSPEHSEFLCVCGNHWHTPHLLVSTYHTTRFEHEQSSLESDQIHQVCHSSVSASGDSCRDKYTHAYG